MWGLSKERRKEARKARLRWGRVAATPRRKRGYSEDGSRRRRGCHVVIPRRCDNAGDRPRRRRGARRGSSSALPRLLGRVICFPTSPRRATGHDALQEDVSRHVRLEWDHCLLLSPPSRAAVSRKRAIQVLRPALRSAHRSTPTHGGAPRRYKLPTSTFKPFCSVHQAPRLSAAPCGHSLS